MWSVYKLHDLGQIHNGKKNNQNKQYLIAFSKKIKKVFSFIYADFKLFTHCKI